MTNTTSWILKRKIFDGPAPDTYGFVYCITNKINGKQYIGKKLFWHKKTRIVKGKKKRYLAESDWKDYYGSSPLLLQDVQEHTKDNFQREILHLCKTKGECSYYEAKEQFKKDVLLNSDKYYNEWIIVKVHKKHLPPKQ